MDDDDALRLSVLDIGVPRLSVELATRVEVLGYQRYWLSEHHGEGSIANPTLLAAIILARTQRMRVGTAGILLRYASPIGIAEAFRTLAHLFPGRLDLGLARGGTAPAIAAALTEGRSTEYSSDDHAARVAEVGRLLFGRIPPEHPLAGVAIDPPAASPGAVALWVHSTSQDGARLAARVGSCYGFLHEFDPVGGPAAARRYVGEFQPSAELEHPVVAVCVGGYCGADEADARRIGARLCANISAEQAIVGNRHYWCDRLGAIAEAYGTAEIVIKTMPRSYDLDRQSDSLARIAEAARTLRSPRKIAQADRQVSNAS
jgi:luciferase family oxidoreductase group 1